MADTQLAPTDAELTAIYRAANGEDTGKAQPLTTHRIFRAMRAAIAKWGQPAHSGEPVAYTVAGPVTDWSRDFSAYKTKTYVRPVFTAPQPVEREPLTDEQWQRIADLTDSILTRATKDEIERVTGIKGGQHGADTK